MPEPTIARVLIERTTQVTVFNPETQTINLNDSVFWANNTGEAHWPAPDGGADNQWLAKPIPAEGESPQVTFDTVNGSTSSPPNPVTTSFGYHCAKHPHNASEKGVITVVVAS